MDFKQIEAFISVAKLKSFSKAANSIYLSQPTISSHISSLEKELNLQLFDRTSKEVALTPAGQCFLEYALNIINTKNNAINVLSTFNKNIEGILNLSASTTPCNTIVPHIVQKFSSMYPKTKFNIKEESSGEVISNILNSTCEIGIIGKYIKNDKIECLPLINDELVIISHKSLELPSHIPIDDLANYRFVMRGKDSATRTTFEDKLHECGINPLNLNILCEVNSLDTIIQFVKTGLGISIISKNACKDYISSNHINMTYIKDHHIIRNIYITYHKKHTLSPIGKAFLNLCKNEYKLPGN